MPVGALMSQLWHKKSQDLLLHLDQQVCVRSPSYIYFAYLDKLSIWIDKLKQYSSCNVIYYKVEHLNKCSIGTIGLTWSFKFVKFKWTKGLAIMLHLSSQPDSSKCSTIRHIHPFTDTFIHWCHRAPSSAICLLLAIHTHTPTAMSSGAIWGGYFNMLTAGVWDWTIDQRMAPLPPRARTEEGCCV